MLSFQTDFSGTDGREMWSLIMYGLGEIGVWWREECGKVDDGKNILAITKLLEQQFHLAMGNVINHIVYSRDIIRFFVIRLVPLNICNCFICSITSSYISEPIIVSFGKFFHGNFVMEQLRQSQWNNHIGYW